MKSITRRSDCPISCALDRFGDKWSLLIIRDLLFKEKSSYGEFLASEEKIATNILSDRLQTLQQAEIIKKIANKQDKRKDIYRLTKKGIDLLPILIEIILWSAKYDPQSAASKDFVSKTREDKNKLIQDIIEELKTK